MRINKTRNLLALMLLVVFFQPLNADDKRVIPLDLYMIIDGSGSFQNHKDDAVAWINGQVVDRLLLDDDRINIWAAGDSLELIFSGTVSDSGGKEAIKDKLTSLAPAGKSADFSGALRTVESRVSATGADRMPYTMLVTASVTGLASALSGNNQSLLRWSRSEKYEQWQVLVVGPEIGRKVSQAALAYINSQQR